MTSRRLTRRELVRLAGGAIASPLLSACAAAGGGERLSTPAAARGEPLDAGWHTLGTGGERDGVVVVPASAGPFPLVLMLHGAGGSGRRAAHLLSPAAQRAGCVVVAPDSRGATWDAVTGQFGPDATFVSRALGLVLARCPIDPARVALAGFSDGATYALGLGRANGDRFSHLLAFSPGFLIPAHPVGTPSIYVSHGLADQVLPIDSCSRRLVPALRRLGYRVQYHEFAGRHEVPPAIAEQGLTWFLDRRNAPDRG